MKNSFILFLSMVLIISCGDHKKEETKPILDSRIQQQLDEIENEWKTLINEFSNWESSFQKDMGTYLASRPLDSMKTATEKNTAYNEILGDSWKKLYEDAVAYPEELKQWHEANLKTIASFNTESANFSKWKKEAESGKYEAKKISAAISHQKATLESGRLFLEDIKTTWENMKLHDSEMINSFRTIF